MAEQRLQPADIAWLTIIVGGVIFEFSSKDLLSDSSARAVDRHKVLARAAILALAGHLACVMPYYIDIFNSKNVFHRTVAHGYRRVESKYRVRRVITERI